MRRPEMGGFVSIAAPASHYDFGFLAPCPCNGLIYHGAEDELVPESSVKKLVDKLNTQRGITIDYRVLSGRRPCLHAGGDREGGQRRRGPRQRPDEPQPDGARRRLIRRLARRLDRGRPGLARPPPMPHLPCIACQANGLGSLHRWWSRSGVQWAAWTVSRTRLRSGRSRPRRLRHPRWRPPCKPACAGLPGSAPISSASPSPPACRWWRLPSAWPGGSPRTPAACRAARPLPHRRGAAGRPRSRAAHHRRRPRRARHRAQPGRRPGRRAGRPRRRGLLGAQPGADRSPPGGAAQHRAVRHPGTAAD